MFVIDAEKSDQVRSQLAGAKLGLCAIDGWWSSTAVAGLMGEKKKD